MYCSPIESRGRKFARRRLLKMICDTPHHHMFCPTDYGRVTADGRNMRIYYPVEKVMGLVNISCKTDPNSSGIPEYNGYILYFILIIVIMIRFQPNMRRFHFCPFDGNFILLRCLDATQHPPYWLILAASFLAIVWAGSLPLYVLVRTQFSSPFNIRFKNGSVS